MAKTSILLADDHTVVRQGLKALLTAEGDMEVVAEAENGQRAVELARTLKPDVVIMDLAMPMMNGLAATRQILKAVPAAKILVLTSYHDEQCVKEMLEAGAIGFIMKESAATELAAAVRNVRRGTKVLSPALARQFQITSAEAFLDSGNNKKSNALTIRELEVLKIIVDGFTNQEIADQIGISIKTVEKHRQQVMNKLNIHEVAGLTRYALANRLVDPKVRAAAA